VKVRHALAKLERSETSKRMESLLNALLCEIYQRSMILINCFSAASSFTLSSGQTTPLSRNL
ncbi:hypothetical protein ACWOHQ_004777, partial [Vibrio parahaemolyticus]